MSDFNLGSFLGSAFTGTTSLLSGLFGAAQQSRNIVKQIAAQREENERTRAYNLSLARQQNAWNIDQWNRENAYNSPQQIMARLSAAGLNPDMIYSGGVSNFSAASSPSLTAGAPGTSVDMSNLALKPTVGDVVNQTLQDSMLGAQAKLISAQAKKTDSERRSVDITNMTLFDIDQARLTDLLEGSKLKAKEREQVEQNIKNLNAQYDNIIEQTNLIKAQATNMEVGTFTRLLESSVDYALKTLDIKLKSREYWEIKQTWPHRLESIILQNDTMRSNPRLLFKDLFENKEFKDGFKNFLNQSIGVITSAFTTVEQYLSIVESALDRLNKLITQPGNVIRDFFKGD